MKMRKNWKIEDYGDEKRLTIKKIGKWNVSIDIDGTGYYPNCLSIEDEWTCYYMNADKAWDDFYPLPRTVINWCENIGVKYLRKFLEENNRL